MSEKIIAYKAFNKDWTCNPNGKPFQYKVGETFTFDGEVEVCKSGFHSCELPLDIFKYYNPCSSVFALVEASGDISRETSDSKIASSIIKIEKEVGFNTIVEESVKKIMEKAKVASSGNRSPVASSGNHSPVVSSGNYSPVASSGDSSPVASSGNHSPVVSSGNYSPVASSGDSSPVASSGNSSPVASSGNRSPVASSGNHSPVVSSGNYSPVASSGDSSPVASSGNSSPVASSGDWSPVASSGNRSPVASSGNYSPASVEGENSIAASLGVGSKAKASEGGAIMLSEYIYDDGWKLLGVFASMVGQNGIKPDVWYELKNGIPTETTVE